MQNIQCVYISCMVVKSLLLDRVLSQVGNHDPHTLSVNSRLFVIHGINQVIIMIEKSGPLTVSWHRKAMFALFFFSLLTLPCTSILHKAIWHRLLLTADLLILVKCIPVGIKIMIRLTISVQQMPKSGKLS